MNEILETYCSTCARKVSACEETRAEHLKVRDAWVDVDQVVLTCPECGGRIGDERVESANLRRAYEAYREGQGLLSASQIRDAYDSYGLSQASFGKLLGLGGATLSRYENGGVQTRQIDQAIRAASDPHAMLDLLAEKGAEIPAAQRGRAEQRAREKLARGRESRFEYAVVRGDFSLVLNPADASELTGFRAFDVDRAREMAVFFASRCKHFFKLRFFKTMFYADFTAFAETSRSMSGLRYAHAPNGPIVHGHEALLAALVDGESLDVEEHEIGETSAEKIVALRDADLGVFSERERIILQKTADFVNSFRKSSELSERSHDEPGWRGTENGQLISYEYAFDLTTTDCINGECSRG